MTKPNVKSLKPYGYVVSRPKRPPLTPRQVKALSFVFPYWTPINTYALVKRVGFCDKSDAFRTLTTLVERGLIEKHKEKREHGFRYYRLKKTEKDIRPHPMAAGVYDQ